MNKIIAGVLAGLLMVLPAAALAKDRQAGLPAGQVRVVLPVEGLTCGGCVAAIKIAVKKLDGIVKVEGDHDKGTATVTYVKDKATVEQIVEKINSAGFKASMPKDAKKQKEAGGA